MPDPTTPRDVIERVLALNWSHGATADDVLAALDAAGIALVPKPSEDRVQAFVTAWGRSRSSGLSFEELVATGLAVANAADTRPRELYDRFRSRADHWDNYGTERGTWIANAWKLAAAMVAETFGLEVKDGE